MKPRPMTPSPPAARRNPRPRGFALVIVVSLMVLLGVLATGLLSLASLSLRTSGLAEARAVARANARLAVTLALGELQKHAGDDRRVTADAGILDDPALPQALGVWDSWSADYGNDPTQWAPDFDAEKRSRFRGWLMSHPTPAAVAERDWVRSGPDADWPALFRTGHDGFDLGAPPVPLDGGRAAWAIVQENTKAKINVAGPEEVETPNDRLHAQARPHLGPAAALAQPDGGWNRRAARVVSLDQVALDSALTPEDASPDAPLGRDFTTHARGLLTNVVHGGLKTDLNLGFEMPDDEFARDSWDGLDNPFRSQVGGYDGQTPLHTPLVPEGEVRLTTDYGAIGNYLHTFHAAEAPTFDTLRSFYRIPRHLYDANGLTAFERQPSNVSWPKTRGNPLQGTVSRTGIRPVLDRLLYFLSVWKDAENKAHLVITPIVTLWNPHNVAIETQGHVIYPWIDFPINIDWTLYDERRRVKADPRTWMSLFMSSGRDTNEGRTRHPYFFLKLTGNGNERTDQPIRFEPGEVRVFSLVDPDPRRFERQGGDEQRTWWMRPVGGLSEFNTSGGVAIRVTSGDSIGGSGFPGDVEIEPTDMLEATFQFTRRDHHYFISMEDAGRLTGRAPSLVSEIQSHNAVLHAQTFKSPLLDGINLDEPQVVGVLETYHRVAVDQEQVADLVYTTNPRQVHVNRYLTGGGTFAAGPHYEASMRRTSSIAGAGLQITPDGRRAYYGASNSADSGRSQLAFFEIPRAPLLSLAGFQHADVAPTPFGAANQIGNAWASPYLARNRVARIVRSAPTGERFQPQGLPIVDTSYLANEALWDGFFFSGAAPRLDHGSATPSPDIWERDTARVVKEAEDVLRDFIASPAEHPLRNTSMRLHRGGRTEEALEERLSGPEACLRLASHLLVDGAFNVNSTSEDAWTAVLAGLRGQEFDVEDGSSPDADETPFPRFRHPRGRSNDGWDGYRTLDDGQVRELAGEIVSEIRERGPFLSLAEFVNRRPGSDELGLDGALQAAIDRSGINEDYLYQTFETNNYPDGENVEPAKTGAGIPGYLTQADILNSLGPRLTARSDTFVIRGYGEARDTAGEVVARSWCEAVVQRLPEWIDASQIEETQMDELNPVNARFGRRMRVVSFREIPRSELNREGADA